MNAGTDLLHSSESANVTRAAMGVDARTSINIIEELTTTFLRHINHRVGHVVHGPGVMRMVHNLSEHETTIVKGEDAMKSYALAKVLMILCLGFERYASRNYDGFRTTLGEKEIRKVYENGIIQAINWFHIVKECLRLGDSGTLGSIEGLQAVCVILLRGAVLLNLALSNAQELGLHRLGAPTRNQRKSAADFVKLETEVRMWTYLCIADWSLGGTRHLTYRIQPSQTTTRLPLNVNDENLEQAVVQVESGNTWTTTTFVLTHARFALVSVAETSWTFAPNKRACLLGARRTIRT